MASNTLTKPTPAPVARPADAFGAMRDEMDRMFERFEQGWALPMVFSGRNGYDRLVPEFDVHDDGKAITIEAELPGVAESDVTVTLTSGLLTIKGHKKSAHQETGENCYLAERSYGAFERSLRLPASVDDTKLEATFDKGVLKLVAPKRPEAVAAERIIPIVPAKSS